jgi:hypothetical protein
MSLTDLLVSGGNTVRIVLRDGCGGPNTGTTPLWLVGSFADDVCIQGVPGQWAYRAYVSEDDGLVLGMARLGPRLAVRAIQVPSFSVTVTSATARIVGLPRVSAKASIPGGREQRRPRAVRTPFLRRHKMSGRGAAPFGPGPTGRRDPTSTQTSARCRADRRWPRSP